VNITTPSENETSLLVGTWNVNGLRAAWRKGFAGWLEAAAPDLLFLQEIRASRDDLRRIDEQIAEQGYQTFWNPAIRPGYAGTGLLVREGAGKSLMPVRVETSLGLDDLDTEGRTIIAHFPERGFAALGAYFPNGTRGPERLEAKRRFYGAVLARAAALEREHETVILCGDFNTAHTALDLANPSANAGSSGFLPAERAWIDELLAGGAAGYADIFREAHPGQGGHYTWWSPWGASRQHNTGWRFDYLLLNRAAAHLAVSARIDADASLRAYISDHAPLLVRLQGLAA